MPEQHFHFINLTPHEIVVETEDNKKFGFPPCGTIVRVEAQQVPENRINGIPILKQTFGEVENLPAPAKWTIYIVAGVVRAALGDTRQDVVAPNTAKANRNEAGQIVSVPGFVI